MLGVNVVKANGADSQRSSIGLRDGKIFIDAVKKITKRGKYLLRNCLGITSKTGFILTIYKEAEDNPIEDIFGYDEYIKIFKRLLHNSSLAHFSIASSALRCSSMVKS